MYGANELSLQSGQREDYGGVEETRPHLGGVKGLALLFTQLPQAAANSRSTQIPSFRL